MKERIRRLKEEKNAVILAHYYAPDAVQELADYVGDSFYLAKVAKGCTADIIVFCGVGFMGESAKILNPLKKVLMPAPMADCPMAHMVAPGRIEELRAQYEDLAVVCYINSTAELKAKSDVCVTSSNAVSIVRALPNRNIFFIPDKNLGSFVAEQVPQKNIILNEGCCPIHAAIRAEELAAQKAAHPHALVLSHPECDSSVLALSDYVGSTAEIISYVRRSAEREFIVCTEEGVAYTLQSENPDKRFLFPVPRPCCADMKLNTPERLLHVLLTEENEVLLNGDVSRAAKAPLDRMLALAR